MIAIIRQHRTENNLKAGESLVWLTDYAVSFDLKEPAAKWKTPFARVGKYPTLAIPSVGGQWC